MKKGLIGTLTLVAFAQLSWASIVFDNFDVNAGHFGFTPTFSGTTSGIATSSTNTRDTTLGDPFDGAGCMKLVLNKTTSASSVRVRYMSGGPPYNSTTGGVPAYNTPWTYTGANDGRIGLYLKAGATAAGWQISLNLDSPANSGATMAWSGDKAITADNAWHLYEWTINTTTWAAVPGIGGGALVAGTAYTFDSFYIRNTASVPANTVVTMYIDFVAKTDANNVSIATLVPEPSSLTLGVIGGFGLLAVWISRRRSA